MNSKSQLLLFLAAVCCMDVATGVHESILNNFLRDTYSMSAGARGWLELPRELPGFLVVAMTGLLCMVPVTRLGVVGAGVFVVGMIGMSSYGWSLGPLVMMMMVASAGQHLLQPVGSSIAIGLGEPATRGKRMGQMGMVGNVGVILGSASIWLLFDRSKPVAPQYRTAFLAAGGAAFVAALLYASLHIPHLHRPRARLVVKRKFRLYYLLELLFGARKQIFITFGPWVLVQYYNLPASGIAKLLMTGAVIGVFFKPMVGAAIDRFGERAVMIFDGLALSVVCVGYGYAAWFTGSVEKGMPIACVCLVLDNLLFALGTSRAVYASRLADTPEELTSSLSLGISINHVVSMTIPAFAGAIWDSFGYERVFLGAAFLALSLAIASAFVPPKAKSSSAAR